VKLKRARNSLLNISKLPPELLGDIFCRNATFKGDFGGLGKRSRNFLFVCHHWFEVASSTPEVWSFWGNTPKDWARWHQRSGTAPLDLVLGVEWDDGSFDADLSNVLQDRATQDTIRRIHLKATDSGLLKSIISSSTTDSEELRSSGVESFMLQNGGSGGLVDISDFFAHYRFPRLQRLEFYNCTISSWNLITSRITTLTILDLDLFTIEPTPTTSQVLSILASNPTLRKVTFSVDVAGADAGDVTLPPRVPLRHLKELKLDGYPQGIFGILDRLDLPRDVDILDITLDECAVEEISQTIGPYLRDYLRHRGMSQLGLGLSISSEPDIELQAGDVDGMDFFVPPPARMNTFLKITIEFDRAPSIGRLEKAAVDLITHAPREGVTYFLASGRPLTVEKISTQLPNLRGLHFERVSLPIAFPRANPDGDVEIFRCLRYLFLDRVFLVDGDWGPLTTFLLWRARSGRQLHSLVIVSSYRALPSITQEMAQEFRLNP